MLVSFSRLLTDLDPDCFLECHLYFLQTLLQKVVPTEFLDLKFEALELSVT